MAVLTGLAAIIRAFDIEGLPAGLHGDEAINGIEGLRILREGWIGPYSPLALGMPTGTFYLTAISVWLLGPTILAVRLVPVLLGTLTIPVFYLLVRRSFGVKPALVASLLIATLSWEIHYSRMGFPQIAWPLIVAIAVGALVEAIKKDRAGTWAAAGFTCGLGVYVYNAQTVLIGLLSLLPAYHLWKKRCVSHGLIFAATLLLAALPMIAFAADPVNRYFGHFNEASLFTRDYWQALDAVGKMELAGQRYLDWWQKVLYKGYVDEVDSIGLVPIIGVPLMLLSAIGMILGLKRHRGEPLVAIGLVVMALLPFTAAFTVGAYARRTLPMALFLCMFAGIAVTGLLKLVEDSAKMGKMWRSFAQICLVVWVGVLALQNLQGYFGVFGSAANQRTLNAREFTDAVKLMKDLGPGYCFYFLSDGWSINYEPRQYLLPTVCGENRSAEFGRYGLQLGGDLKGRPVFVLLGKYRSELNDLQALYPRGSVIYGPESVPTYIAYIVDQ